MATRLIGTDTADPRLPALVVAATQGTASTDLAAGNVLGAVATWSPTVTGLTKGNGVQIASYLVRGRTCHATYDFTFGTTSAKTAAVLTFTLPVTALGWGAGGVGYFFDASAGASYPVSLLLPTKSIVEVRAIGASATYATAVAPTATIPFTWTTSDGIFFEMTYLTT